MTGMCRICGRDLHCSQGAGMPDRRLVTCSGRCSSEYSHLMSRARHSAKGPEDAA